MTTIGLMGEVSRVTMALALE